MARTSTTGSASRAGWTGRAQAWTRPASGPSAGDFVGANPVDRGKPGSKIQLVCEGPGLPLTAAVTAANVADVTRLQAMVDDIPPVRTPSGRQRHRPGKLDVDKGCGVARSARGSPAVGSSRRVGSAATAGGWSGRRRVAHVIRAQVRGRRRRTSSSSSKSQYSPAARQAPAAGCRRAARPRRAFTCLTKVFSYDWVTTRPPNASLDLGRIPWSGEPRSSRADASTG
jgi:hypothetical protein